MKKYILLIFAIYASFAFGQKTEIGQQQLPTEQSDKIYESVENIAQFPGGINAFRTEFSNNFRDKKVGATGNMSCEITFVIERNGEIDNVKILGNNASLNKEAERAIKKIKQKWTPAKINGTNVRYRFRMPIKMAF